jgi:hypothetical protein
MKIGRELDALVAEKILGCKVGRHARLRTDAGEPDYICECDGYPHQHPWIDDTRYLPDYSSDMSAAWEIIEKLKERFDGQFSFSGGEWTFLLGTLDAGGDLQNGAVYASSASAPHAICLAALKALGIDPQ